MVTSKFFHIAGLYLGLHPANERRRYKVNAVSHWLGANLESALYRINTGVPTEHSCTIWLATPTDHRIQKRKIINKSSGHNERGLTPLDYQGTKGYQYIVVHYCTVIRKKYEVKLMWHFEPNKNTLSRLIPMARLCGVLFTYIQSSAVIMQSSSP